MIDGYQRETNVSHRRGRVNRLTNLKIEMPPFFPEMKKQISKKLIEMQSSGVERVAFYGLGDEMEVAYITLQGLDMKLVGIIDDEKNWGKKVFDYEVIHPREAMNVAADGILITSMKDQASFIKNLNRQRELDSIKIFTI